MTRPTLTPTAPIVHVVGPVLVHCYVLESGVFRTEVQYLGGGLIDELSRSYPTERQARHHARVAAQWFAHGMSVREVLALVALLNTPTRPDRLPCERDAS